MEINYIAVLVATVLQFIFGAVWYSFLFGPLWGKIHGFDTLSKEVQQKMMSQMGPYYAIQVLVTALTTFVLAVLLSNLPNWNPYILTGLLWLGFVVPILVSGVIFGGTESKWIVKKIAVQAGASFFCMEIAAVVLYFL